MAWATALGAGARFSRYWQSARVETNSDAGAHTVFTGFQRWVLLAAFVLLVVFRLPQAWVHGRFQDEEATVFLAYAWHFPWDEALFRPFAGYWNLGATAPTVAAVHLIRSGLLALEHAPYFTMTIALFFQTLPAVLILTGKAPWLASRPAVIAALLMIATAPATEEVFFNVMHIQFHLALCVALILALDVPRRQSVRLGYGSMLFLAPLCGLGAIVLVPLFGLRALVDRSRGRIWQMAILASGAAVQMLLFYGASPVRGVLLDPLSFLGSMFIRLFAGPMFGVDFANRIAIAFTTPDIDGTVFLWLFAAAGVLMVGTVLALALQRRDSGFWMAVSSLLLAVITFGFGIVTVNPADAFFVTAGERYNFLPVILLGLSLIALATRDGFRDKAAAMVLCALFLVNGAIHYPRPVGLLAEGPSWPAEVKAWRSDHRHPLAVWPRPWAADLSDQHRPCSQPTTTVTKSNDPRYCESGWMAAFYASKEN